MSRISDQLRGKDISQKVRIMDDPPESVWRIRKPQETPEKPEASTDWSKTAATRYLCAAAHLDSRFREQVIDQYVTQKHRALVLPDGVDMSSVLIHCMAARRNTTVRDLILTGATAIALLALYSYKPAYDSYSASNSIPPILPVYFIVCFLVIVAERWKAFSLVVANFLRRDFNVRCVDYPLDPELSETLQKMSAARQSKAIIYSGFSPFVGCGTEVGGWSFALDTTRGKEDLGHRTEPAPVKIEELYTNVAEALRTVTLSCAVVEDKLFVNGRDIAGDPVFLPNPLERPIGIVDTATVNSYLDGRSSKVRFYKNIKIVDWDGELVLNIFLRFTKPGNDLFVEATYLLLTPLQEKFHAIDGINPTRAWRRYLAYAAESAVIAPFAFALPIANAFAFFQQLWDRWEIRKMIRRDPTFDHGAQTSVREEASSGVYRRYFQKLDKEMYVKVIERQILDTIVHFLDERNIDTSDLRQRQTAIMNEGVIVSGGGSVFNTGSMAVGEQSRSTVSRIKQFSAGAAAGKRR